MPPARGTSRVTRQIGAKRGSTQRPRTREEALERNDFCQDLHTDPIFQRDRIAHKLNTRPRKRYGYRTPEELFN
jgi:hypothetical protein